MKGTKDGKSCSRDLKSSGNNYKKVQHFQDGGKVQKLSDGSTMWTRGGTTRERTETQERVNRSAREHVDAAFDDVSKTIRQSDFRRGADVRRREDAIGNATQRALKVSGKARELNSAMSEAFIREVAESRKAYKRSQKAGGSNKK